jgi:XRE family transcriptional regulator, regulator of sulfur utilization
MVSQDLDLIDPNLNLLGAEVRRLRKSQGITLEVLSDTTGISRVVLGRFEHGKGNITTLNLLKISEGVNTPLSKIFKTIGK